MKKIVPLLAGLIAAVALSACSPSAPQPTPLTLEMRLVQGVASDDTEPMPEITHDFGIYHTNVLNVGKQVLLDKTAVKSAAVNENMIGFPAIEIQLTAAATQKFAQITREHVNQRLAIIIDGQICEAPVINTEITGGKAAISGSFSLQEAKDIVRRLNALVNKD